MPASVIVMFVTTPPEMYETAVAFGSATANDGHYRTGDVAGTAAGQRRADDKPIHHLWCGERLGRHRTEC